MKTSTPTPGSCRALVIEHLKRHSAASVADLHRALKPLTLATVKSTLSKSPDFACTLTAGKWLWSLRPKAAPHPRASKAPRTSKTAKSPKSNTSRR